MRTIAQFGIKDPGSDSQSMVTETAGPRGSNSLRNGGSSLKQVESIVALGDLHEDFAPLLTGFSEMPAPMPGYDDSIDEAPPPAPVELRVTRSADHNGINNDDTPIAPPPLSSSALPFNFNTTTAYSPIELPTNPFDDEEIHRRMEPSLAHRYGTKPLSLPFMELLPAGDGPPRVVTTEASSPREILNGPWRGNGYTTPTTTTTKTMPMTMTATTKDERGDAEKMRRTEVGELAQERDIDEVVYDDDYDYGDDDDDDYEEYRPSSALPRALRIANRSELGNEQSEGSSPRQRERERERDYGHEHQWTREAIMDMNIALGNGGGGGSGIGRYG